MMTHESGCKILSITSKSKSDLAEARSRCISASFRSISSCAVLYRLEMFVHSTDFSLRSVSTYEHHDGHEEAVTQCHAVSCPGQQPPTAVAKVHFKTHPTPLG